MKPVTTNINAAGMQCTHIVIAAQREIRTINRLLGMLHKDAPIDEFTLRILVRVIISIVLLCALAEQLISILDKNRNRLQKQTLLLTPAKPMLLLCAPKN